MPSISCAKWPDPVRFLPGSPSFTSFSLVRAGTLQPERSALRAHASGRFLPGSPPNPLYRSHLQGRATLGRVEAERGGVQARRRRMRAAPFRTRSRREGHHSVSPSPLIEPDVTISVIRLSDGFHVTACAATDARVSAAIGHPVPQTHVAWETADSQTRRPCAGGGENDGRCGTGAAPHRAALS
jgi:hypothetical protein